MSSSSRLFQSESSALTENMDLEASVAGGPDGDDDHGDFDHYIDGIDNVGMDLNNIVDLVSETSFSRPRANFFTFSCNTIF